MSYPINYPTPQGANIQIFQGGDPQTTGHLFEKTWVKPQGASFVWFTLIGAGSFGDNSTIGGGSGAVTNFMGPAFLMPDILTVTVGKGGATAGANGGNTLVSYQQKDGTGYTLLTAEGGSTGGNSPTASNYFSAMGFYQSVAGEAGSSTTVNPSSTTFLSVGTTGVFVVNSNYGYSNNTTVNKPGFFQTQPIIVGVGGNGSGKGGVGCGGGINGIGGDGMVVIITW